MPIPIEYTVDDVIAMLKNDKSFGGCEHLYIHRPIHHTVMHSVGEELGTIDNLSRNQLETEGESTVLRVPNKRVNGGYEQPEVTSEDTSEDTTASADADVTRSAASLAMTSLLVHHAGRK